MNLLKSVLIPFFFFYLCINLYSYENNMQEGIVISYRHIKAGISINDRHFKTLSGDQGEVSWPITAYLVPGENKVEIRNFEIFIPEGFQFEIGIYRSSKETTLEEGERLAGIVINKVEELEGDVLTLTFDMPDTFKQNKMLEGIGMSYNNIAAEIRINDIYYDKLVGGNRSKSGPILQFLVPGTNTIEVRNIKILKAEDFHFNMNVYRTPIGSFLDEGERLGGIKVSSLEQLDHETIEFTFEMPNGFETTLNELEELNEDDIVEAKKLTSYIYKSVSKNKIKKSFIENFVFHMKLVNELYPDLVITNEEFINEIRGEKGEKFIGSMEGLYLESYFNGKLVQPLNVHREPILKFKGEAYQEEDKGIINELLFLGKYQGKVQVCFFEFTYE